MTPEHLPIEQYPVLLAEKVNRLTEQLSSLNLPDIAVFPSALKHYRMRAEFRIWHDGDNIYHVIFDHQTKQPIKITDFPAASELINRAISLIIPAIRHNAILRQHLFQIDYLSTLSNEIIVTLLYHRPLDEVWRDQAVHLRQMLRQEGLHLDIIGRASKTQIILNRNYVNEILHVNGKAIHYRQIENSFSQPNAMVNCQMLAWAQNITQKSSGDLLELYCGNGNFSLALAANFQNVLATEIATTSVQAAKHNCLVNRINNMQIVRMSAQELTQAIQRTRIFYRLRDIDLTKYCFNTLLIDPPRSGLDEATRQMAKNYQKVIYISCNLDSLHRDLTVLSKTHTIEQLALFDQFPYTHHIECGALLSRQCEIEV